VAEACASGILVYPDMTQIETASADCVISHHALEHTADPEAILCEIFRMIKPGGKLVVVVSAESPRGRHALGEPWL